MKRWIPAWAVAVLLVAAAPLSLAAEDDAADIERLPEIFYTPDTLMTMRIDLASITGDMLKKTMRGVFNDTGWKLLQEDEFGAGLMQLFMAVADEYDKVIRVPFEGAGGSSIWIVMMSSGGEADNRLYMLIRLGRGLGIKPPENIDEWVATDEGKASVEKLTAWAKSLDPSKQLMGTDRKEGEPNPTDFRQVRRVGEYLVCTSPGTPLPSADQFDPTALIAFTQAMHIGSRQKLAFALFPHKRWRDGIVEDLKKAQEEVDEKKAEGKTAGMGDVLTAKMMIHVLDQSHWIAGWVRADDEPSAAIVVRAKTEQAAGAIKSQFDTAIAATYALAMYYDSKEELANFLSGGRKKEAETSYMEFARKMIGALGVTQKGPLIGLVLETREIQDMTLVGMQWEAKQEKLREEQKEENKRESEKRR